MPLAQPVDRETALKARAWPFEEARKLVARFKGKVPEKGYVLFETGYGPSGLPHIGTFGEVARTTMIRRAFEAISDIPTKLLCFSDDMDGMRKIPANVPQQEMLHANAQKPLTAVPDPFGKYESFGHHNNAMLRRFLDTFGFEYEFASATDYYKAGKLDAVLLRAAERYDAIMAVMLASLREERRQTYSCFLPISPTTGRVLYVPMKQVDGKNGTVTFTDEDGTDVTLPVTGGNVKLQWKPDFGARWAALDVDFEMYGKDHSTNTPIYDRICEILGGRKPEHFTYELFLDENGEKIAKSRGNGLTMDEWLSYASAESLGYFMFLKPKTAKRLYFDVIPRAVDDYLTFAGKYGEQDEAARLENPVWHIHGGPPPEGSASPISFNMLLNLVSASNASEKAVLWGFISSYIPGASAQSHPELDRMVGYAIRYFEDFVRPTKHFRAPTEAERTHLAALKAALADQPADSDAEGLQSAVFAAGKAAGYENLRDWFGVLYETLLGQPQGPRMGSFIALYGVGRTEALIDAALARTTDEKAA